MPPVSVEIAEGRRSGTVCREDIRGPDLPGDLDLVQVGILPVEVCPVDEELDLVSILLPRGKEHLLAKARGSKAPDTLLAENTPPAVAAWVPSFGVGGNVEPGTLERGSVHAMSVIPNFDASLAHVQRTTKPDQDDTCVGVVGVLHQFDERNLVAADEVAAECPEKPRFGA